NFAQNWPNIYLYDSAQWMSKIVMLFAKVLRVNINDESIAEDGMEYRLPEAPVYGHDIAINPVVVILATFCFIWCLCHIRKNRKIGDMYTVWVMLLFIMFCGVVRWESFVSRYMLPYLALLCPLIGWQAQTLAGKSTGGNLRQGTVSIIYFLCITEMISLSRYHQELWHEEASVRPEGFFAQNKGIRQEYLETLDWVRENGYKKIGLKLSGLNYEYPVWYILDTPEVQIEHVLVENQSAVYEDESYIPDCILGDVNLSEGFDYIIMHDIEYCKAEQFIENERMAVYLPKTDTENDIIDRGMD
ncbi:MAG: hypothetical protein NC400_09835, partial [Clostridium sp.]|nr:hypothetical protein [Clostridium sp.]